jgi:hypothetical protein
MMVVASDIDVSIIRRAWEAWRGYTPIRAETRFSHEHDTGLVEFMLEDEGGYLACFEWDIDASELRRISGATGNPIALIHPDGSIVPLPHDEDVDLP